MIEINKLNDDRKAVVKNGDMVIGNEAQLNLLIYRVNTTKSYKIKNDKDKVKIMAKTFEKSAPIACYCEGIRYGSLKTAFEQYNGKTIKLNNKVIKIKNRFDFDMLFNDFSTIFFRVEKSDESIVSELMKQINELKAEITVLKKDSDLYKAMKNKMMNDTKSVIEFLEKKYL